MLNTVLSGSCSSDFAVSGGNNIESPGDTCGSAAWVTLSAFLRLNSKLGPLQQNGGPTQTHEPGSGSLAIDAIDAADCEVEDDQRGVERPQGARCDVGAVEVVP